MKSGPIYCAPHQSAFPPKPKELAGSPLSQAWDYLVNCGGVCKAAQFDDDFSPAGPSMRDKLAKFGVRSSTSGSATIIFLPDSAV